MGDRGQADPQRPTNHRTTSGAAATERSELDPGGDPGDRERYVEPDGHTSEVSDGPTPEGSEAQAEALRSRGADRGANHDGSGPVGGLEHCLGGYADADRDRREDREAKLGPVVQIIEDLAPERTGELRDQGEGDCGQRRDADQRAGAGWAVAAEVDPRNRRRQAKGSHGSEHRLDDEGGCDRAVLLRIDDPGEDRNREDSGAELDHRRDRVNGAAAKDPAGRIGALWPRPRFGFALPRSHEPAL